MQGRPTPRSSGQGKEEEGGSQEPSEDKINPKRQRKNLAWVELWPWVERGYGHFLFHSMALLGREPGERTLPLTLFLTPSHVPPRDKAPTEASTG